MSVTKRNILILFISIGVNLRLRPFYNYFKLINRTAVCLVQTNCSIASSAYSGTVAAAAFLRSLDIKESYFSFQILINSLAAVFLIVYD